MKDKYNLSGDWLLCDFHIHTNISDGLLPLKDVIDLYGQHGFCLLYTSPSPRDRTRSRMPSSA